MNAGRASIHTCIELHNLYVRGQHHNGSNKFSGNVLDHSSRGVRARKEEGWGSALAVEGLGKKDVLSLGLFVLLGFGVQG